MGISTVPVKTFDDTLYMLTYGSKGCYMAYAKLAGKQPSERVYERETDRDRQTETDRERER